VVSFISDAGYVASGKVGAGGAYTLLDVDKPEIPVATYKVAVSPPAEQMSGDDYDKYMSAEAGGDTQAATEVIPGRYASHATGGLSFDVKQGPNTINIELKK
jgi:hypothetical protein